MSNNDYRMATNNDDMIEEFPTCARCGVPNVEDAGDHVEAYGHWPQW